MAATDGKGIRVWQFFLVLGFIAATIAVWREPTYTRPEQLVVLSLACVSAALVAVAVHRALLPLISPERIVGDARRSQRVLVALEREKRLVLRTIKELEFDRAMGKVADADFDEMVGRLRERALGLMVRIEQGQQGLRERVERDLASPSPSRPSSTASATAKTGPRARRAARTCGTCDTPNDKDARFCKQCGGAL